LSDEAQLRSESANVNERPAGQHEAKQEQHPTQAGTQPTSRLSGGVGGLKHFNRLRGIGAIRRETVAPACGKRISWTWTGCEPYLRIRSR